MDILEVKARVTVWEEKTPKIGCWIWLSSTFKENKNECKHFREIHFVGRLSSNDDTPIFLPSLSLLSSLICLPLFESSNLENFPPSTALILTLFTRAIYFCCHLIRDQPKALLFSLPQSTHQDVFLEMSWSKHNIGMPDISYLPLQIISLTCSTLFCASKCSPLWTASLGFSCHQAYN